MCLTHLTSFRVWSCSSHSWWLLSTASYSYTVYLSQYFWHHQSLNVSFVFGCFLIIFCIATCILLCIEYVARVVAYPDDGPFRSHQSIPLQCTITPEPPFPIEYLWRSSAHNHIDIDNDIPSKSAVTTVFIEENHPSFARYFCHVLSAVNHTTLAVGSTVLHITGKLAISYEPS